MSQESSNASVAVAASIGSFMEEAWMTKPFLSDEWRWCSICLECLNCEEADKEVTLPCKHKFHPACIQTWLAKRDICPLCGINVKPAVQLCRINVKPAVQLCRINVKPDVPAMMEENDEINVWVNMITNMAQLWHCNVKPDVPAMMEENDEINVWVNMITNMAQPWHFDSL